MDFNDTPEEAAFRSECRSWLEANAKRLSPDHADTAMLEERSDPDTIARAQAWQAKKADGGWACMTWPKEYGGRGATSIQSVIWNQEERRFRTPPNVFAIGQGMLGPTIMAHGTDAQKRTRRSSATCARCCAARRSGASSSASRRPAPTSPGSRPAPCATARSGW
jgi:alkylation response protein AidB-like acyl-CoA dehydrogenase